MGEYCDDCSAERARIAALEAEIRRLKEIIRCLKDQVDCLENLVDTLRDIIRQALRVAEELRDWLQDVLDAAQWVLDHKSGIRRGTWGYALGSKAVSEQALSAVNMIIDILEQDPPDCHGGCD